MNPSVIAHVPYVPAHPFVGQDLVAEYTSVAARPVAPASVEQFPMEDGGILLTLEMCDDMGPQWSAWMEWVDARS